MGLSAEKEAYYRKLEEVIEEGLNLFGYTQNGEMLSGFVLVINQVSFEDNDVENVKSSNCFFTRRGQQPVLTRGILEEFRDYYRGIGHRCDGHDDDSED